MYIPPIYIRHDIHRLSCRQHNLFLREKCLNRQNESLPRDHIVLGYYAPPLSPLFQGGSLRKGNSFHVDLKFD